MKSSLYPLCFLLALTFFVGCSPQPPRTISEAAVAAEKIHAASEYAETHTITHLIRMGNAEGEISWSARLAPLERNNPTYRILIQADGTHSIEQSGRRGADSVVRRRVIRQQTDEQPAPQAPAQPPASAP